MTNTLKRILAGGIMIAGAIGITALEYFGIGAVRWVAVAIVMVMSYELLRHIKKLNPVYSVLFILYSLLMLASAYFVGGRPWIILLMLLIISFSDMGAWRFGKLFGGDKMWEHLSPNKTWAGQIAGIICGTFAGVLYGLLGADIFMPQLMWIGISVALLSQYGDLTASWIKRKLDIKDFGNIIPGHGGSLDRFDGWIYVLPIVWRVML
jgi:phosphatidate cytidylyltransferase